MYHVLTHSLFWQSFQQTTFKRCLGLPIASGWNTMDHTGALDTEDELGPLAHLAPSPQSEAVAHEFQELSLQSSQYLPPLNERKNGEFFSMCYGDFDLKINLFVSPIYFSLVFFFFFASYIWQSVTQERAYRGTTWFWVIGRFSFSIQFFHYFPSVFSSNILFGNEL